MQNQFDNEMIFLMGLPAAGKSTIATKHFAATHTFIDPDEVKKSHPDYDPKQAFLVHDWSTGITDKMFADAVAGKVGRWVIDGTGTNADSMVHKIKQVREAGTFAVKLFYVKCTLATSLRRAAKRERQVPESVITGKAKLISTAFEIVQDYVDFVEVIDNDIDR